MKFRIPPTPEKYNLAWHNGRMPRRSSKPKAPAQPKRPGTAKDHDFATIARNVVEQAIGEKLDGSPLDEPNKQKHPGAVALGKLGGAKGGKARAATLSAKRRSQIAKAAARARWTKEP